MFIRYFGRAKELPGVKELFESRKKEEDEEMEEGEEEPMAIDEADDEEERLIMNGGAGIPIGPVRTDIPYLPFVALHILSADASLDLSRTAYQDHYFPHCQLSTLVGNVLYLISMRH